MEISYCLIVHVLKLNLLTSKKSVSLDYPLYFAEIHFQMLCHRNDEGEGKQCAGG